MDTIATLFQVRSSPLCLQCCMYQKLFDRNCNMSWSTFYYSCYFIQLYFELVNVSLHALNVCVRRCMDFDASDVAETHYLGSAQQKTHGTNVPTRVTLL